MPLPRTFRLSLAVLVAVAAACSRGEGTAPPGELRGDRVEVLAVWSGAEQQRFQLVLDDFERRTGVEVTYTSAGHGLATALGARLAEGRPPDVAFVPQPGLLRGYARQGVLLPLPDMAGDVERNYAAIWRELASFEGRLYGVPFKAANKSLLWYDVASFQRAGVVPPGDVEGLVEVAHALVAAGIPAFSVGGADGWTLTDWFENLYLRVAGGERYDLLAEHRIAWTHPTVTTALGLLLDILAPELVAGGVEAAVSTKFEASVERAFTVPASAAMVFEGDFVAGVVTSKTKAELGVDVDVFPFPAIGASRSAAVGGGDFAVLLRRSDAGEALVRYLASPDAAARWAAAGGYISPNLNLDLSVYPDDITRALARGVLDAGDEFRFDLSDLTPAAFGGTEGKGLRGRLQELLVSRNVVGVAAALEADAAAAYGP